MNPFDYSLSLRLRHPNLAAAEITAALGMEPSRDWDAGKPRARPTGAPLEGRNESTYWTCRVSQGRAGPDKSFAAELEAAIGRIERKGEFLRAFVRSGGSVGLFIGWFGDGNIGVVLPPVLLARIAALEAALELDIYPGGLSAAS
jgi:Domain of unknown function (DUF4279)